MRSKTTRDDRRAARREARERGYWTRWQGLLAGVTAPVLAVGVVFAGAGVPAYADDTAATSQNAGAAPGTSGGAGATPDSTTAAASATPSPTPTPTPTAAAAPPAASAAAAPPVAAAPAAAPPAAAPAAPPAPAAPTAQQPPAKTFSAQPKAVQAVATGAPVLTITKTVVNTGGGTAGPGSWTYTLTGKRSNGNDTSPAISYTFQSGVAQSVTATATSGTTASTLRSYAITESGGPADYTLSSIVCTGATGNGTFGSGTLSGLQLHSGDTAACTITNTYTPPPMATITVRAGGQRTAATSVGALPDGAVYQAAPTGGGTAVTCTIAAGQCSMTVPAGSAYDVSAQTAAPGYYLNPTLDVGGSSSGAPTAYSFRTGTLAGSSTTTVPGTDVNNVYSDANGNRFSGLLAQSLLDPGVQQMCGLRIALVLDQSGSMAGTKQANLQSAANSVVTSLTGTPSSLAIYTFAAAPEAGLGTTSTATTASAQPLHDFIDGLPAPASYTNWDRGLGQVGSGFNLVILLTDGNPTTYGDGSVDGSNARLAYVEQGIFSANRIKGALGERLVTVGIGVDGGTENLRAVSGPTSGTDYFPESSSSFGDTLKALATGACSNVVTVQTRIEDTTGAIVNNAPAANGWSYTGTTSSGTLGSFADTATQNGSTGFTSASINLAAGSTPTIALTEALKPGYALDRATSSCLVNGQAVALGGTGTTLSFTGAANVPIACTFVNKVVQTYGTVSVTKHVTGDGAQAAAGKSFAVHFAYPAGSGFAAGAGDLTVTDGSTATSPDIPTGAVVTLTEPAPPAVTGATWGSPAFTPSSTLTIGDGTNTAVDLTNPITLDTASFTVQKSVIGTGAGAVPSGASFTVNWSYPAKAGVYPAASGTLTVTKGGGASAPVAVPVGAVVSLGESAPGAIAGVTWGPVGVFTPGTPITAGVKGSTLAETVTNTATLDTGTFSVIKTIAGDIALVPAHTPFTVHYTYPAGSGYPAGQGDVTATSGGAAVTSAAIPHGAVVHLTETNLPTIPDGTWGTPSFSVNDFSIGNGTTTTVTLSNPITHDTGSFDVKKTVTGTAAALVGTGAQYTVHYQWDAAADGSYPAGSGFLTVKNDGVVVAGPAVPVGATVTLGEEPSAPVPGATLSNVAFSPDSPLTITGKDSSVHVTLTNTYTLNLGTFSVTKEVTGASGMVPDGTSFTVDYSYPAGPGFPAGSGHLTVTADGGATHSAPLPEGAVVHLSEAAPLPYIPAGTWGTPSFTANDIVIGNGSDTAVTLTNPISHDTGVLSVTKAVIGTGAAGVSAAFAFTVTYHWDAAADGSYPAGDGTITLHADGAAVGIPAVPVGAAVTLTESAHASPPGVTWASGAFSPPGPVTVLGKGQTVAVTLTNTYTLNTGSFAITKHVTGSGAYLIPPSTVYTVHYHYTGGIAGQPGAGTLGLLSGTPEVVSGLPEGAVVTFAEDAPAAVTGATWGAAVIQPNPVTIGTAEPVSVSLGNPVTEIRPTLQLEKVVAGGLVPPTDWILTGTGDGGSPSVTNPAGGGTSAVAVNSGASYALAEAPAAGFGAGSEFTPGDWSCIDTHGRDVTVTQSGAGAATLAGLVAGQAVVCTIVNTHRDQGVTIQKTLAGPAAQNADGTWTIAYDVRASNRSAIAATSYSLTDTLHFGGGITVNHASWSGPTTGNFSGAAATLAVGRALAAGATDAYTVTVNATVTAAAWNDGTTDCPEGHGSGGFLNTATLLSADRSAGSSACDAPATLTVNKVADGAPMLDPATGHFTVDYTITVTNTSTKPQFYDLVDEPHFASGIDVVAGSATKDGDPIPFDGSHLAAGAQIGAGTVDAYTVRYAVSVAGMQIDQAACDGAGTGLFNSATLTTGTVPTASSGCADIPTGTVTLMKDVASGFGGTEPSGSWTLTAAGDSGRTVSGRYTAGQPNPGITHVTVPAGGYTLSEGPAVTGYALTQLTCVDAAGAPVGIIDGAFQLRSGQDVACTFTNTPRPAHLTLIKDVEDPQHSGNTRTPHDWTLTAAPRFPGFTDVIGRGDPSLPDGVDAVPVWSGAYDLSESGPAGFDPGAWRCEGANVDGSVVTVPLGADVTCTISNTAELPHLTLVKNVENGATNGSGTPSDWVVSAAGPTPVSGPGSDDPAHPNPGITGIGVAVGDYTLSEDASGAPVGYEWSDLHCVDRNGDITTTLHTSVADPTLHLSEGDDVVCTFTNRAVPAAWTLSKTSDHGLSAMPGDVIGYTLTLTHTAGVYPKLLTLPNVDDLSDVADHATFVPGSLVASSGTATVTGGRLSWTLMDPAAVSFTLSYAFRIDQNAWGVAIRNALTPPQNVRCVGANHCVTESDTPDLDLWKTSAVTARPDPQDATGVLPGGQVTYTLHAYNPTAIDLPAGQTETDDLTGVIGHAVIGSLGAGLAFDGAHTITWTVPGIPAGGSADVTFVATVSHDRGGYTLTNTLVPGAGHCAPSLGDQATDAETAAAPPEDATCTTTDDVPFIDLGIVKTSSTQGPVDDDPGASSSYTYSLAVTNHGDEAAVDATVTDPLPSQIVVDTTLGTNGFDQLPAGWTPAYDAATNTVTVGIPSMTVGESDTIVVHVQVKPVVHGSVNAPVNPVDPGQAGPTPTTPPDSIDNTACVAVAGDMDASNDCSTSAVPQKAVEANIYVQCQADIPYLHYAIRTTSGLAGDPVTLNWTPSQPGDNGVPATDLPPDPTGLTRTLHDGDAGAILWPGGAVNGQGVSVGFPGWRPITAGDYNPDGTLKFPPSQVFAGLVYDPSSVASDAWRYPSTVTISVNPTAVYTVSYPPATPACAVARTTAVGFTKTASEQVVSPGGSFTYTLQAHNLSLGAANPVTISDPIPADIRVDGITTDQSAFPRWQGCAVTGAVDGYGGTLGCTLFGPLSQADGNAPAITLSVTLRSTTTASSISNTATLCFADMDDPARTGCEPSTATIYTSAAAAVLAATGLDVWWGLGAGSVILLGGIGALLLGIRRRRIT